VWDIRELARFIIEKAFWIPEKNPILTEFSRGWVAAPYQTTRDKIDLYLTNDASNLSYKRDNRQIYSKISEVKAGLSS